MSLDKLKEYFAASVKKDALCLVSDNKEVSKMKTVLEPAIGAKTPSIGAMITEVLKTATVSQSDKNSTTPHEEW